MTRASPNSRPVALIAFLLGEERFTARKELRPLNPISHSCRLPDVPETLPPDEWGHGEPVAGWAPFYKHMIRRARQLGLSDAEIARVLMRFKFKEPLEIRAGRSRRVRRAFDAALKRSARDESIGWLEAA